MSNYYYGILYTMLFQVTSDDFAQIAIIASVVLIIIMIYNKDKFIQHFESKMHGLSARNSKFGVIVDKFICPKYNKEYSFPQTWQG